MPKIINHWSPDTCECQFDYSWDSTSDPNTRVHSLESATACKYHTCLTEANLVWEQVRLENTSKNNIIHGTIVPGYGSGFDPHTIQWTYGSGTGTKRTLSIILPKPITLNLGPTPVPTAISTSTVTT